MPYGIRRNSITKAEVIKKQVVKWYATIDFGVNVTFMALIGY